LAETIGLQTGSVPLILNGGLHTVKDKEQHAWAARTAIGVSLLHEAKIWGTEPIYVEVLKAFYEFGYGEPDCEVYRYWDPNEAAKIAGTDANALTLKRGGRALVLVVDYGDGGECRLELNTKLLALSPELPARDALTDEEVKRVGPGAYTFAIKKHDFKLVRIGK